MKAAEPITTITTSDGRVIPVSELSEQVLTKLKLLQDLRNQLDQLNKEVYLKTLTVTALSQDIEHDLKQD